MLQLYTTSSCTSCRKAKKWLMDHDIPFVEKNFFKEPLTVDELKSILRLTEEGTSELISVRSQVFQKINVDMDKLTVNELLELVTENPSLLRRPIIADNMRLQIGFNEDDIRVFLPREVRRQELHQALLMAGL